MSEFKATLYEKQIGKEMAIAINGGDWDKNYNEWQKRGWYLKARWVINYRNEE